jgi:hypothetical protein
VEEAARQRRSTIGDAWDMAARVQALTPPGARIGAFNAGMLGAVSAASGRTVVNLDGVVDHDALAALREFRLAQFVRAEGLTFVMDEAHAVPAYEAIGGPGLSAMLEPVATLPTAIPSETTFVLWRVR